MANPEHVAAARKGARAISALQRRQRNVQLDLWGADLAQADLSFATLMAAMLPGANLTGAILTGANLMGADLTDANLTRATVRATNCHSATFDRANFTGAEIRNTSFSQARFDRTVFNEALCGWSTFTYTSLATAIGLETADHHGPSSIGVDTLRLSRGQIPEAFLRGCGFSDWEIRAAKLYAPGLGREEITRILYDVIEIRAGSPIQISPLFISYAHADAAFVEHLGGALNAQRIRFWRDVQHMTAGPVERQLEHAITMNPTFVLVLSEHSASSDWVEWETEKARKLERELAQQGRARHVLCPVALDDSWKTSAWSGPLRNQIAKYNVLDFSRWQDAETFKAEFDKLLKGLKLYYGNGESGER